MLRQEKLVEERENEAENKSKVCEKEVKDHHLGLSLLIVSLIMHCHLL